MITTNTTAMKIYAEILKSAATATSQREVGRFVSIARAAMMPTGMRTRREIGSEVRRAAGTGWEVTERPHSA